MKTHCLALALLGSAFSSFAVAQTSNGVPPAFEKSEDSDGGTPTTDPFDPDRSAPKNIQVQVEYIELAQEALTKLLFLAEPKTSDAGPLRKQLQELVAKNEAKVLETQLVVSKPGQRSAAGGVHEFIYPTEYTEPTQEKTPKEQDKPSPTASFPSTPSIPTAFDTRNVGSTLEIEPTLGVDGKIIDLRFSPELVWHTGNIVWLEHKDEAGNVYQVQMPDIYTIKLDTSVSCISGQYMLVAIVSPKDAKGERDMTRKVVLLLKCDALPVK
jgi:hypothetical protein